ncbi:hypothetical protein AGOR_G00119400 [Albula goreensis]|uniref:CARD domain-containing protein n=1 Tax=Albula goreensis TaxID=1534307 RepID=A0A8T3DBX5_9TELE|nr:hypothetical protein AGOR_G00119400 [Albula goreensis]
MNRPGLAGELKEFYEKEYGASAGGGGAAGEPTGGMCHVVEGRHFIDYHRTALIERVSNVEAILDRLLDKRVLTQQQYEDIASESTSYQKMRKLMNGAIKSGGTKAENELYTILEEVQHYLMDDLKQKKN